MSLRFHFYNPRGAGSSRAPSGGPWSPGAPPIRPRGILPKWTKRLLVANVLGFLVLSLVPQNVVLAWLGFAVPGALQRPWTAVTYMFVHGGFFHLFSNMLVLFFLGPRLERKWGGRFFLKFYFVTGLAGALSSILLFTMLGQATVMVGASAAIYGLLVAFALNWPNQRILLWFLVPVRAKWLVGALAGFTLLSTLGGVQDGVAHWAHLGGLVSGFVYLRYGERFRLATRRSARRSVGRQDRYSIGQSHVRPGIGGFLERLFFKEEPSSPTRPSNGPINGAPRSSTASRGPAGSGGQRTSGGRRVEVHRSAPRNDTINEVDRILDKIREKGMASLTPRERLFLEQVSQQYQDSPRK